MITFIYLFTSSEHDPVNDCVCQSLSCVQLYDPMDCSPPGSSVQGILQARVLEWVAISFSRGYSWHRDRTHISCIAGGFFTVWATRKVLSVFRHKNSIVVGEETEAHWPPTPDFYLPVQGLGYTLLHSTPSRISCRLLPGGRVSGAHLMACVGRGWPGSRAVDGGAEEGCGWRSRCCVRVGGGQHWIGDPSWDSTMISMGDRQSPLLSRWGNWGGDSSNLWEGRGLPSAPPSVHSSSPGRHRSPGTAMPCQQSLSETQGGTAAGPPGRIDTLHSCHAEGHPPPPQLLGEGIND